MSAFIVFFAKSATAPRKHSFLSKLHFFPVDALQERVKKLDKKNKTDGENCKRN